MSFWRVRFAAIWKSRNPIDLAALFVLVIFLFLAAVAAADEEDDEEPQLLPGVVATYETAGAKCVRREESVQFVWGDRSPDERLPPGEFSARWRGQLLAMSPGKHRFYLYAAGQVSLEVAGKRIISGQSEAPKWFESPAIELEFGHHPLAIEFEKTSPEAQIGLYWSGPQFEPEPVPGRLVFHEPADDPGDAFERGAELWRALRCANCHRAEAGAPGLAAPSLANLSGNIRRDWLIDWLRRNGETYNGETAADSPIRMPQFNLGEDEAHAVAAFLMGDEKPAPPDHPPAGDFDRGQRLFTTLGCLACHQAGKLGSSGLFGGGDLSHVADKRPPGFFERWLAEPAKINPAHRMPVFQLSDQERGDLAAWLTTLRDPAGGQGLRQVAATSVLVDRGRRLVDSLRCGACHALPGQKERVGGGSPVALNLEQGKDWQGACLGAADRQKPRPGYALLPPQRDALIAYLTGAQSASATTRSDGSFVLRERNCLGCHARDSAEGIARNLAELVKNQADLAPLLPTLTPPALTGVGDKLHDAALADAITLRHPPLRPWLAVRMPRFNLAASELTALTGYFTTIDRIPQRPRVEPKVNAKALTAAGRQLVTSAGFGCTSCHKIGSAAPIKATPAAHGTDLSMVGKRIRRPWFDRWVRNPARIVPRMEMPSIQVPARGVLGEKLDTQLSAVWHVLNVPGFEPPPSGPIRIAQHRGDGEPPIVITDVTEADKQVFVRPLVMGLNNRHNLLFDLSGNRLAGWWLGDTAHQLTRGKGWHWAPAGANLLSGEDAEQPEVALFHDERPIPALPLVGSSLAEIDWFETTGDSVMFAYRLKFVDDGEAIVLRVVQQIAPRSKAQSGGFHRRWEIGGAPAGYSVRIDFRDGENAGYRLLPAAAGKDSLTCETDYLTQAAPPAAGAAASMPVEAIAKLSVVPGYEAVRLPLPRSEMPTGLAWRRDGALAFCSLKGGVWLARDTDGDSLEDHLQLVTDGLAAPYGIACREEAIDVAAKYGLVRLSRFDKSGRAARADIVASGWGYTADYHDWAIGLPRDAAGNYYVGLPCQQDNRSAAEAHLRGAVLKLHPRRPTPDRPRLFDLEVVAAGVRFPMGLALDRQGEIFASDNQGNYNPFNELNHIRQGARYGFINKLDAKPDFSPPYDDPAIAIPHPWTRSVNGICFLRTPEGTRGDGRDIFGPFEGHLIGCEFDTRRLIRMSLEKIGDVYQGAAYPFSVEPAAGEPTFEGPVVCAVSPKGDLYIGNLRDSGWGGGQNTGSIVRLRPSGPLPMGIAEVHALAEGFAIDFTAPVDRERALDASSYAISSYRRITTPAYGGPDVDRESEAIAAVELSVDRRCSILRLKRLRPGFVYEFQLKNLAGESGNFFPAEAHYTLRKAPPR